MTYYIIAGEASGDLHGSNLMKEILKNDPTATFRCWGGDLMKAAGGTIVVHYKQRAFMGFLEVALNIFTILGFMKRCKKDLLETNPDLVIFIDYPGFNIPMARFAKHHGYKTIFYISPQVWAWKEKRVATLKQVIDKMLVILPFEKDFYKKWDYAVDYVGHPLVQVVDEFKKANPTIVKTSNLSIALLPGSRLQEISKKLPIMLELTRKFPEIDFAVAQAPSIDIDFYDSMLSYYPNVRLAKGRTYQLLMQSHAALVTSGTATLETALFGVPQVVCYKGSQLSYAIAKRLIKVKYISLVNLILDKTAVKELIQQELTVANLEKEIKKILFDAQHREQIAADYNNLYSLLSKGGLASAQAAAIIQDFVNPTKVKLS
jgi:lipid-A-disaccharide synthase